MSHAEHKALSEEAFSLSAHDFERVRELIYRRAGITLAPTKRSMVYSRLSRRLRDTGHTDVGAYLDALGKADSPEWQSFVNALTTNLTSFFREGYHFPVLAEHLRRLVAARGKASIWCAAASTGEEPYSLAITAIEALGAKPPVTIFASDIDTDVLAKARRAVYPINTVESLEPDRRRRFFMRGTGSNAGMVRVRAEVAGLVEFGQVNLAAEPWPFREPFDVVFCRNVMIYFDTPTKAAVLTRIHRVLRPEGLLFVGHSENFSDRRDLFSLQGKTVYRKVG
ncbi:MAG TPA: CheR family methyltransferase [Quisquiliibacterium sp.]|nr:CheR family methyltransferase [Quisquiliibacterium sp.]HPA89695.1 CheR family methyltransferase [Quisquiliibacterium sp.]HQN10681.1 CheR family methyltransferase [Quisquiliibacterium sp.]HQP66281.1 CheR family methyltransferase [Quisquiliibacterium sp.]